MQAQMRTEKPKLIMLKRPLHARFGSKVLAGIKRTTIRDTPWPLGKPIMLYHWTGKPYRSPQQNVAAVEVEHTQPMAITVPANGRPHYSPHTVAAQPLWQLEGFDSQDDMDAWFIAKLKPDQTVHKHLMIFKLLPTKNEEQLTQN